MDANAWVQAIPDEPPSSASRNGWRGGNIAVAITWRTGQATPIHDHKGSDCAFLIVEGTSTETIYETDENGLAAPSAVRDYAPGEVCAADEPDIHRISNDTDGDLINLHVYTPPLSGFGIYEAA